MAIVTISGDIDAFDLRTFTTAIDESLAASERGVILDLSRLEFVNSTALGHVMKAHRVMKSRGGALVLAAPSEYIARTLASIGLEDEFTVRASVDEAIGHFADR